MTTVLGVDPSLTNTGLAVLRDGQPIRLHSIGWPGRDSDSYADRRKRIVNLTKGVGKWVDEYASTSTADLAVIEGPSYGSSMMPSYFDRAGLWWGLYSALNSRGIPVAVVAPGTRAKWATGSGRAEKGAVLSAVSGWYPGIHIRNHDIADAVVLALMGTLKADRTVRIPFLVKERHYVGLESVAWPK